MSIANDEGPPLILQADSELANQIQDEIRKKLQDEYSHAGSAETISSILPEYIKVIVCNAKVKSQVISDLNVFLNDEAPRFVDWLWQMLADRNPARTHSAFSKKRDFSDDEAMEVDRPRDYERSDGGIPADELEVRDREQPNLKGFRSALQWVARDNSKRDRDREERRRERRDRDKDDRGDRGDRERRGDRDRRRRRKEEDRKSKKSDLAPTRFTITDSKGAGFDLPEGNVHLNVVPAVDRSLLTQPATTEESQTKFTITLNKIDASDVPSISHYNTPKPPPAEEPVPWWQAGKGGKGGKGVATTTPPWKQWSSGNMVYTAPGVAAGRGRGSKGGSKFGKKAAAAPTGNMVWQNPALLTEEQKAAQEAALAKKVNAPLSASILHKGNKVWVNPSLKEKEGGSQGMDVDTAPTKAPAPTPGVLATGPES